MGKRSLIHLNGHMMVAIDVETTGLDPDIHEIVQIACVPVDADLRPLPEILNMYIRPERPEDAEVKSNIIDKAVLDGVSRSMALDIFEEWFESLGLPIKKRIVPLAHNWVFDQAFLKAFFGTELYDMYFDARYRDTMVISQFMNDRRDFDGETIPFPKFTTLRSVIKRLGIEFEPYLLHDALYDATKTAEAYRQFLIERIGEIL